MAQVRSFFHLSTRVGHGQQHGGSPRLRLRAPHRHPGERERLATQCLGARLLAPPDRPPRPRLGPQHPRGRGAAGLADALRRHRPDPHAPRHRRHGVSRRDGAKRNVAVYITAPHFQSRTRNTRPGHRADHFSREDHTAPVARSLQRVSFLSAPLRSTAATMQNSPSFDSMPARGRKTAASRWT
jgi:hypothetical protein